MQPQRSETVAGAKNRKPGLTHTINPNFAKLAFHESRSCRAALPNTRI
ncbi:MAG: hypothetical protein AVDCRST_MAG28-3721 [uncultured Rubrobacteraceae bacterium]|uniref:Uncharacterized protein n=1 Tax=uncultured Rubrobacteraceae bacterium TaxID=349277 RepID=A0A6J4R772_9ACTN|nr:MAG: hypothetical protein AVDCRST_MAG28-3721 [uncultured Rubrobacteraceae bacterium]